MNIVENQRITPVQVALSVNSARMSSSDYSISSQATTNPLGLFTVAKIEVIIGGATLAQLLSHTVCLLCDEDHPIEKIDKSLQIQSLGANSVIS